MAFNHKEKQLIDNWNQSYRQEVDRPNWDEYFILQAYLISIRSLDAQTQCGCVIVRPDKYIISTGYNSFISGIDDKILPNLRPEKYPFFLHSEKNAILSCAKQGKSCENCTVYITSQPCIYCFQDMIQAGISEIVYYDGKKAHMTCNEKVEIQYEILKKLAKTKIRVLPQSDEMDKKIASIKSLRGV